MAFYYPEGPLGPVCDVIIDEVFLVDAAIVDEGDGLVNIYPTIDWSTVEAVLGDDLSAIRTRRCRQRVLADGSIEYYDCQDELQSPIEVPSGYPLLAPIYDWPVKSTTPWGLSDNFEGFEPTAESCNPHDPDINIFPVKFYRPDGTFVEKKQVEKSSPVTFPVDSFYGYDIEEGSISATFVESGGNVLLRATGTGTGNIGLRFEWNDDPNAHGTATSSVSVGGVTFNQSGTSGNQNTTIEVTAGVDYPVSIVGGTGYGGYSVTSDKICFRDLHENDCNASLIIGSATNETTIDRVGWWSDDGNNYAVWVNPEVCTLPNLKQTVTYFINIPTTDTYTITGGADDNFNVFLNNSSTPVIGGAGGIFAGGSLTTPYSATTTLQAGTLKMVVECTNSDASFVDDDGEPTGLAFSWQRNPGGWYIKICRGSVCLSATSVGWVAVGPHADWSDFMNSYATYPSNNDPLLGETHTATWNFNVESAGDYTLEWSQDGFGTLSIDGTQVVTATGTEYTTSYTQTVSNLSAGPHTLTGTCRNGEVGDDDRWTNNPAGIAWTLSDNNGIITSSRNLTTPAGGNLIWHTRMDAGYEWVEI
jgi:hypothetical protein